MDIQFDLPKRKRFSAKIMDYEIKFGSSKGMWKAVNDHVSETGESISSFMRELVMNKLNIDEHGTKRD